MATPDPAVAHAASMLVTSALHLHEGDRFVVICDDGSSLVADLVMRAAEAIGVQVTLARLDQLRSVSTNHTGERPHKVLPDVVRRAMLAAQASVFLASAPHQEHSMREQLQHIVGACKVRHAHMPGLPIGAFAAGLRADCAKVEAWGRALERRIGRARLLVATSPAGTDLRLVLGDGGAWTPHFGVIPPGTMSTLPAGALFLQPSSVEGVFVADASVGEFFGAREGLLATKPVTFHIEEGLVVKVEAPGAPELERDIEGMRTLAPNCNRVGLVMLGVNAELAPTGSAAVDENLPGLHILVGDAAGRVTKSAFSARASFSACGARGTVNADGVVAVADGKLT